MDEDRGLGKLKAELAQDALEHLVNIANGDARVALNALETAAFAIPPDNQGRRRIDLETISDALQRRFPLYDKADEGHYDTISAFIKSVRGSSPDGALYWLARMIEAGEDPLFIARRLVILAAEDIGLAEPEALAGSGSRPAGGAFPGDAGRAHSPGGGYGLSGYCPQKQHRLYGPGAGAGGRAQAPQRASAPAPA